ncbi:MAG: hypothetical protein CMP20_04655 [Rickettsiales bacterium]|nr:hypothetical protein [Rickettsiales bacterium]
MDDWCWKSDDIIPFVCELLDECDAFIGCMAWCTNRSVLEAMKGKNLGMVINHTRYKTPYYERFLAQKYSQTAYQPSGAMTVIKDYVPPFEGPYESLGQVRQAGEKHTFDSTESTRLMHCKFLVFGKMQRQSRYFWTADGSWNDNYGDLDGDVEVFVPYGIWLGSANFTEMSNKHEECGTYLTGKDSFEAPVDQWFRLYMADSVPLRFGS